MVDDSGWFPGLQLALALALFIVLGCAWGWEDAQGSSRAAHMAVHLGSDEIDDI